MDLIKQKFIGNILRDEGKRTLTNQGRAINKELKYRTGYLERNRKADVIGDRTLRITVPHYHRLLDIKRDVHTRRGKAIRRKSRRIYNRFIMGAYNSIAFRISNDFNESVIRDIRLQYKGVLR